MLPIRANANVPVNENNPSNARELLAYYNLEQYPKTHLFYGPQFTDQYAGLDENQPYTDDKPKYEKDEKSGRYVIVNDYENAIQNYNSDHGSLLPRMWSGEHAENYMIYSGPLEFSIKSEYKMQNEFRSLVANFRSSVAKGEIDYEGYHDFLRTYGRYLDIEKPSLIDNIYYLLDYQIGYMYWRYFMWNFSGRQDDIQGKMDMHGNWISGINFIDEYLLGITQDNLPSDVLNNKARNTYYFIPLLIGLLGILFLAKYDKKTFWVLLVFFLFTGLALKVYLNERPFEPRERDYALVGSFYVFAIWIGYGVYALYEILKEYINPKVALPIVLSATMLGAPVLMVSQNWDDHDRSNRYTAQSMARMYLDSIEQNGIIFTIGDNDTFALWYLQNIEGYRRDVRVVNTALFATDWYIDDMKKKAFDSDPIPSQLTHKDYKYGSRDYIIFNEIDTDSININVWMDWIASDDPRTMYQIPSSGQVVNTFPTKTFRLPVDKQAVLKSGVVALKDQAKIVPYIDVTIKDEVIYKNRLLMLDIIANNNWQRPIYFSGGSFGDDDYLWMKDYLQMDGVVYKLVPIKTPVDKDNPFDMGRVDADKSYEIVKNWDWGNSGDPAVYHDIETRRNGLTYRSNLARIAEALLKENKLDKAREILDLAMEKMPVDTFAFYSLLEPYMQMYYSVNQPEKARDIYAQLAVVYQEKLLYFSSFKTNEQIDMRREIYTDMERYRAVVTVLLAEDTKEYALAEAIKFNEYIKLFPYLYNPDEGIELEDQSASNSDTEIPAEASLQELFQSQAN